MPSKLTTSSHLLVGLFLLALTLHSHPPAAQGHVLFSGTFDTRDFQGWHDVQSISSRAGFSSDGAFEGSDAARFEVRNGDVEPNTGSERSEISGPTFRAGQDLYIRDAIRVPAGNTYSAPWQIVQQLHEANWGGSPGMAVFLENGRVLEIGAGDSSRIYWRSAPLQPNRWYDLIYRVKLSRNPDAGFVEVWLDGVHLTLLNGRKRMHGQTIQAARTYLKVGIYRSRMSTGTSIVEHDAIEIGTGLAAVTSD